MIEISRLFLFLEIIFIIDFCVCVTMFWELQDCVFQSNRILD